MLFRHHGRSLLALLAAGLPTFALAGEVVPSGPYVADARGPIVVGYYAPDAKKVKFKASTGTAGDVVRSEDGVIRAKWTPPKVTSATSADLTLVIDGADVPLRVTLVPPPLGREAAFDGTLQLPTVRVEGVPTELPTAATTLSVRAQVGGQAPSGNATAAPWFLAQGGAILQAKAAAPPTDGIHAASVKLPASTPFLAVAAGAPVAGSTLPAYRTFAIADRNTTVADGKSAIGIVVVAVDRMGAPVPKIELQLSVPDGDGTVPAKVKTDANGVALVAFTPGKHPGFTSVRVNGAAVIGEFPLFLTDTATGSAPHFTDLGDAEYRGWSRAWREAIAITTATAPPPVTPTPPPPVAPPPPVTPTVAASPAPAARSVAPPAEPKPAPPPAAPAAAPSERAPDESLRVAGELWMTRGNYKVESTVPEVAAADFGAPLVGFWGLRADVSWKAGSPLGGALFAEGGANALIPGLGLPSGKTVAVLPQLWAQAALRKSVNDVLSWQVGVGVDHHAGLFFAYTDDARSAGEATPDGAFGARISGAALWRSRRFFARAELAEALAPLPVLTQASLRVEVPLHDGLWATGGLRLDAQHLGWMHSDDGVSGAFVMPGATLGVAYSPGKR